MVSRQLHAWAALSPRKQHQVLIVQEAKWAPEPICKLRRGKNLFALSGIEPQPLGQLSYPGSHLAGATDTHTKACSGQPGCDMKPGFPNTWKEGVIR
jgi:hypothetical protein